MILYEDNIYLLPQHTPEWRKTGNFPPFLFSNNKGAHSSKNIKSSVFPWPTPSKKEITNQNLLKKYILYRIYTNRFLFPYPVSKHLRIVIFATSSFICSSSYIRISRSYICKCLLIPLLRYASILAKKE